MTDFNSASYPVARKVHRCHEGAHDIQPGEQYERMAGVYEGMFFYAKTCQYCMRLRSIMLRLDDGFWESCYGGISEQLWTFSPGEWSDDWLMNLHMLRLRGLFVNGWRGLVGELDAARMRMWLIDPRGNKLVQEILDKKEKA